MSIQNLKLKSKLFFLAIIFCGVFSVAGKSEAATINATSCEQADVQVAINSSDYGDAVLIPSGNCIWTGGVQIAKDIKIIGAGADETILNLSFENNSIYEAFFKFIPDITTIGRIDEISDSGEFEVLGVGFVGISRMSYKYGVWIYSYHTPLRRIKIHDCKFTDIHRAVQTDGNVYGVFYNNELVGSNAAYPSADNKSSWDNYPAILGSGDGWYIEDNTFSFNGIGIISGGGHGMSHVIRYNNTIGSQSIYVESHGNQLAYIRGTQLTEIYGNSFLSVAGQGIDIRGGKAIIFYNRDNDDLHHVREEFADSYSGTELNNACAESDPQICSDNCVCMKVNHSYMWNNRHLSSNALQRFLVMGEGTAFEYDRYDNININDPRELLENREFWTQRPTGVFDSSGDADSGGGVGCGILTMRPARCTTGVGYWATDQSCSDLIGMVGTNPSTPISGTLYKCTTPDTWTEYYTPYTYPHPLRNESDIMAPVAPNGLSIQ